VAVSTAALPARLPDTAEVRSAASGIGTLGSEVAQHANDGKTSWQDLGDFYDSPDASVALEAVNIVTTLADEAQSCAQKIKSALEDLATAIDDLQTEYDAVKTAAATHNAVDTTVEDFDWPVHRDEQSALQGRIDTVASDYDTACRACAQAIDAANTGAYQVGDSPDAPKEPWEVQLARYTVDEAIDGYTTKNGLAYFSLSVDAPRSVSADVLNHLPVAPGFVDRVDDWLDRKVNSPVGMANADLTKNRSVERIMRWVEQTGDLDRGARHELRQELQRHHLSIKDGKITVGLALEEGVHKGATPDPDAPRPQWLKNADRAGIAIGGAFTVAGIAVTYAGQSAKNSARHPHWSDEQVLAETIADTATVEAASTVGSEIGSKVGQAAGQTVGRVAGAAIGQALIPIPGVGAAVGAVAGNFIGGFAGNLIGGAVGGWLGGLAGEAIAENTTVTGDGGLLDKAGDFLGGLFG
jgi:hypothetical protein